MRRCSIEGCGGKHLARGWCGKHYRAWKRHGDPEHPQRVIKYTSRHTCSHDGCSETPKARGMCRAHYRKWRRDTGYAPERPECSVEECSEPHYALTYCERHHYAWKRYGDPLHAVRQPKGTGYVNREGYRVIYRGGRPRLEHRVIMEDSLGRKLRADETVHHINGVRLDNRLDNLELWSSSHPSGQRVTDKVKWAREILRRYGSAEERRLL